MVSGAYTQMLIAIRTTGIVNGTCVLQHTELYFGFNEMPQLEYGSCRSCLSGLKMCMFFDIDKHSVAMHTMSMALIKHAILLITIFFYHTELFFTGSHKMSNAVLLIKF